MKLNLKTKIEKINQEIEDILKSIPESRIATCVPLVFKKGKKQGLIQGAKMMIEDEIKFLIELSKFMTAGDEESIRRLEVNTNWYMVLERLKELQDTELKQLNNWLEKENE